MSAWYYADRLQQQQGPVEASWLQAAFARGEVDAGTLVWREGMAQWQPLAQVAAELGIAVQRVAAPPPRPAVRPVAVAGPRKPTPLWVILLIIAGASLPVLGILAAIAIPAYQDYTLRSKVSASLMTASSLRLVVEEHVLTTGQCPGNGESGIGTPESYAARPLVSVQVGALDDGRCAIELTLEDVALPGHRHTLTAIRRDTSDWAYRTTLPERLLPAQVRYSLEP